MAVPVAFAMFPALEVITEVTVKEPLSLNGATVQIGATDPLTCTLAKSELAASCTISGFAGETIVLTLEVDNAGGEDILISVASASSSPDVIETDAQFCQIGTVVCTPGSGLVPSSGRTAIFLRYLISPSAAPGPVELFTQIVR